MAKIKQKQKEENEMEEAILKMEKETLEEGATAKDIEKAEDKSVSKGSQDTTPLFEMAKEKCTLFRTQDFEAYGRIDMEEHQETWAIRSKHFWFWLSRLYYESNGEIPKAVDIGQTIRQFEGEAHLNSPVDNVHVRFASFRDEIYIDLANDRWEQIRITNYDCSVISSSESPVRFIRMPGMLPLPRPVFGKPLKPLFEFLNIEHFGDLVLIVSWLIGAMRPTGPFPILILQGEQGTAKSTTARLLSSLLDPSLLVSRSVPRSERDLAISANKSWVLGFDNLSGLSPWLSDAFCRISTGGGLATRTLFSDDSEKLFRLKRPLILNGISDIATRHDLADRALIVNLPPIPEDKRRSEREILGHWFRVVPGVLGALCVAVSNALRNIGAVKLEKKPRMADFAEWVTAAEPSLPWEKGVFLREYLSNRESLVDLALEADPVGTSLMELMKDYGEWSGTPTDLLLALNKIVPKALQRRNTWPKRPNTLSSRIRQVAPALRRRGIETERSKSGQRNIKITRTSEKSAEIVQAAHDHSPSASELPLAFDDDPSRSGDSGGTGGSYDLFRTQSKETSAAGAVPSQDSSAQEER